MTPSLGSNCTYNPTWVRLSVDSTTFWKKFYNLQWNPDQNLHLRINSKIYHLYKLDKWLSNIEKSCFTQLYFQIQLKIVSLIYRRTIASNQCFSKYWLFQLPIIVYKYSTILPFQSTIYRYSRHKSYLQKYRKNCRFYNKYQAKSTFYIYRYWYFIIIAADYANIN